MKVRHWIAHLLGWNACRPYTESYGPAGRFLAVGHICAGCGRFRVAWTLDLDRWPPARTFGDWNREPQGFWSLN